MKMEDWDNLEELGIILTKNGNYRDTVKRKTYYKKICKECGELYLGTKNGQFCDKSCSTKSKWKNPDCRINSSECKNKISNSVKNLWKDDGYRKNCSEKIKAIWKDPNGTYNTKETRGKYSERNKKQWDDPNSAFNSPEYRKNLSDKISIKRKDPNSGYNTPEYRKTLKDSYGKKNNPNWKGGYNSNGLPYYDTYAPQLEWCEEVRRSQDDPNILEVKCFKCLEWYVPNLNNVRNRIQSINGTMDGSNHFYCSKECRNSCSVFGKSPETVMKQDAIRSGRLPWSELVREVQPELRKLVLGRDENQCVKCGSKGNLQCHHIDPVANNPIESADMDNCVTLCKNCHKEVHQKDGCRYGQLRMEVC